MGRTHQEVSLVRALWLRDMLRLKKERSRWLGVVLQPLLFWFFIGAGFLERVDVPGMDGDYLEFFFPGIMVMTVLFTTIFATMSVIEDRQSGFLQGVLVGPGSRPSMVIGKLSGVTSLALLQVLLLTLVSPVAGISLAEVNWLLLLSISTLTAFSLGALNFAVAWILNSTQAYHGFMSVLLLPLWILSGAMYPHPGEGWLEWVMLLNPMAYSVDGFRLALSGAAVPLPGAFDLLTVFLGLAVSFALSFGWSLRVSRRA